MRYRVSAVWHRPADPISPAALRRSYMSFMRAVLIAAGLVLVALGLLWPWVMRIGLGHLPGDISVQRPGLRLYAPLGSSLLISIALSLLLALIAWLWRR